MSLKEQEGEDEFEVMRPSFRLVATARYSANFLFLGFLMGGLTTLLAPILDNFFEYYNVPNSYVFVFGTAVVQDVMVRSLVLSLLKAFNSFESSMINNI